MIHSSEEKKNHSLSTEFHSILSSGEWKFTTQRVESHSKISDHWRHYQGSEKGWNFCLFLESRKCM